MYNEASRATLEDEFGTSNDREVMTYILEKGEIQLLLCRLIMSISFL